MVTGEKPDEQVDWSDVMRRAVDEATRGEQLPAVCSAPECYERPVVRWSPSPDTAELLCASHLMGLGVHQGVREVQSQLGRAGVVLCGDGVEVLMALVSQHLEEQLEVLS